MIIHPVAWLYWDPPLEVFTIPYIERPIVWYGVFFVLGFVLGYLITISLFSRFLKQENKFSLLDIKNWELLVKQLISGESCEFSAAVYRNLPSQTQTTLHSFHDNKSVLSSTIKDEILLSLNETKIKEGKDRDGITQAFPGSINSIRQTSQLIADYLIWFVVLGTLIGARLGAVLFYDLSYFIEHPIEIFKVWKGGLASHGGVVGVILSLYFFLIYIRKWLPSLTFLTLLDFMSIPSALAACFIRMGNFMNQEITLEKKKNGKMS